LDHCFGRWSIWIVSDEVPSRSDRNRSFPKRMVRVDLFSKRWSSSIVLRSCVPGPGTFAKVVDLNHCRIWIIDRFGTLSQKWSKSRNDPEPTMIQIRQWSKSMSILLNSYCSSRTDLIWNCHLHFFLVVFYPVFHLARKLENNKSSALEIKRIKLSRNAVVSDSGALTE